MQASGDASVIMTFSPTTDLRPSALDMFAATYHITAIYGVLFGAAGVLTAVWAWAGRSLR
jgi:hypothetical protein